MKVPNAYKMVHEESNDTKISLNSLAHSNGSKGGSLVNPFAADIKNAVVFI